MNDINGIQFYVSNESTKKDDIPNLPNMTISNSGQLIYRIPVLDVEFDIDDLENEVYQYIKDEMQNKIIGSTMTFTTYKYKVFAVFNTSSCRLQRNLLISSTVHQRYYRHRLDCNCREA